MVAKLPDARSCHRFWTFISSSRLKISNTHRDEVPGGRDPRNCRRLWTFLSSSRLKSANNHRDQAPGGRDPRNCRRFWTLISSSRLPVPFPKFKKDLPGLPILKIQERSQVPKPPYPKNEGRIPDFPYPENSGKISGPQANPGKVPDLQAPLS